MIEPTRATIDRRLAELATTSATHLAGKREIALAVAAGHESALAEFVRHDDAIRQIALELEALHLAVEQI